MLFPFWQPIALPITFKRNCDRFRKIHVTSTSQGQKFQKFEEYPKSVRIKMADLAGR